MSDIDFEYSKNMNEFYQYLETNEIAKKYVDELFEQKYNDKKRKNMFYNIFKLMKKYVNFEWIKKLNT